MKLVSSAQMRELEGAAVAAGASLDELMERAGLAVAQEVWLTLGVVAGRRILILAGPGNKGGDGLVAARYLAEWEADVIVYLVTPRAASDRNFKRVSELGVRVIVSGEEHGVPALQEALDRAELVVDALLGIGHHRPIEGVLADVLQRLRAAEGRPSPPKVIAVDVPTGIDADSGRADPLAVRAHTTVTFGFAKVGLHTLPGSECAGDIQVVDIGLPADPAAALPLELLDTAWTRERLPARSLSGNKGTFGHVLVVGGSLRYVGAPRLAAEACYRAGVGLVTIACPASAQPMLAPAIAEATWLPLVEHDGMLAAAAATEIIEQLPFYDALVIGPGLGQSEDVRAVVEAVLANLPPTLRGCVIDADALNALAASDPALASLPGNCVLTPHPGEMSRLRGISVAQVQDDRLHVATDAAAQWKQVVVLKGAHTVIAAPNGRAAISPHANPLLATAGTGDVLAGVIAGLLAQGLDPFDAAACGVFLHGLAAQELSQDLGDRGLLAGELLAAIPRATRLVLHGRPPLSPLPGMQDLGAAFGLSSMLDA